MSDLNAKTYKRYSRSSQLNFREQMLAVMLNDLL